MSVEQPKTPKAPKTETGTVDPDNVYTDGTPESAEGNPTVSPNNVYTDGVKE